MYEQSIPGVESFDNLVVTYFFRKKGTFRNLQNSKTSTTSAKNIWRDFCYYYKCNKFHAIWQSSVKMFSYTFLLLKHFSCNQKRRKRKIMKTKALRQSRSPNFDFTKNGSSKYEMTYFELVLQYLLQTEFEYQAETFFTTSTHSDICGQWQGLHMVVNSRFSCTDVLHEQA